MQILYPLRIKPLRGAEVKQDVMVKIEQEEAYLSPESIPVNVFEDVVQYQILCTDELSETLQWVNACIRRS